MSLDKYERIRVLGKGTFGRAWLVRDKHTKEELVAKEIKVENKQDLEEALAEAEVMSKVHHFNIIKYKEVIRSSPKLVTIVMEYADDGDVADKIGRRKFRMQFMEEEQILKWLVQLCQALDYLHSQGILHRDIKTANLFLTKAGHLKLGDFGIARVLDRNSERVSARTCRTPVGTPMYMSPEICQGKAYGQKADMWALGCVLHEMCALRPAFMAQTMEGLVAKIKRGNHDRHMPRQYSSDLRKLVQELLSINPSQRPSVQEVLALPFLQQYVASAPVNQISGGSDAVSNPSSRRASVVPEIMILHPSDSPRLKRASEGKASNPWSISPRPSPANSPGQPRSARLRQQQSDPQLNGYAARHSQQQKQRRRSELDAPLSPKRDQRILSNRDAPLSPSRDRWNKAGDLPAVELRGRPPGTAHSDRSLSPRSSPRAPRRSLDGLAAQAAAPKRGSADLQDLAQYYSKRGIKSAVSVYSNGSGDRSAGPSPMLSKKQLGRR